LPAALEAKNEGRASLTPMRSREASAGRR